MLLTEGIENVEADVCVVQDVKNDVNVNQNVKDDVVDDGVDANLLINDVKAEDFLEVVVNDTVNDDDEMDDNDKEDVEVVA